MKVSNPLTIVAMFSGIAETFATGALVMLPPEMQAIFIYFVMIFPVFIVTLFFFVLVKKPHVLYAPSDFSDQEHFLHANNLKESVATETEKALSKVSETTPINADLKAIAKKIAELSVGSVLSNIDRKVLNHLKSHSIEAFTERSLGLILGVSKRAALESLIRLESGGYIVSGIDDDTKVWQVRT